MGRERPFCPTCWAAAAPGPRPALRKVQPGNHDGAGGPLGAQEGDCIHPRASGCQYTAKVGDLLFVPSGFRKSYLQSNLEAVAAYKTITGLFESGRRNTDRMKAIIQVLEQSAAS